MAKNKGFKQTLAKTINTERRNMNDFTRAKIYDSCLIALGQLGCSPEFLKKFNDTALQVEAELDTYFEFDYKHDKKDFAYSSEKIDEAIKQYINPEDYCPFCIRYTGSTFKK